MPTVKLLHNPTAGDENHSGKQLKKALEAAGYTVQYGTTKKAGWEKMGPEIDLVVAAGGDGTIRKVAEVLLKRSAMERRVPLAPISLGTANNIGNTLNTVGDAEEVIAGWADVMPRKFDVGLIHDLPETQFFLECFGGGVFPCLMRDKLQKEKDRELAEQPEERKAAALARLYQIVESYEAVSAEISVDGIHVTGKFLLAEVMNIRSMGPNLLLAPLADPGDGLFEVVLVPESHRALLCAYLQEKQRHPEFQPLFTTIKGRDIHIRWDGPDVHVDDSPLKLSKGINARVNLQQGALDFLYPAEKQ